MNVEGAKMLIVGLALIALASVTFAPNGQIGGGFVDSFERASVFLLRSFVFLLILPLLFVVWYRKGTLGSVGFRLPAEGTHPVRLTIIACAILVPLALLLAATGEFRAFYGLGGFSVTEFIVSAVLLPAAYYTIEEFFFRGFLLWQLVRAVGVPRAFLYSNLLFAAVHISKPVLEIPFALFVGLILSFIAYRTRSFIPAAVVHFVVALVVTIAATTLGGAAGQVRF